MAKKKQTIEEMLEEALVPEEEQSYEVPENWVWTTSQNISKVLRGVSYKKHQVEGEKTPDNVLVLRGGNIQEGLILNQLDNVYVRKELIKDEQYLQDGDIVLVSSTGSSKLIGKAASADASFVGESFGAFITLIRSTDSINKKYFGYFYQSSNYRNIISSLAKGSNINNIKKSYLDELHFPLPPLNEQKRIADKVERLLNKIDEAKQLIEEAKESFELRRAAILDKAFRGELSRGPILNVPQVESNNRGYYELPNGWEWKTLDEVADFKNGYAFKSKDFINEGIQLVRMGNLYKNELLLERKPVYLPTSLDRKILERYSVKQGDILLTLTGTKYKRDYGFAVRVKEIEVPLLLNQRILSIQPRHSSNYIFYYLQSNTFRDKFFSFETGGVNQGNVGSKAVESILIPFPTVSEASQIGSKIKKLLNDEDQIKKVLAVESNIKDLKQAILSKAFKGELRTNDPTEENAIELLKEVLPGKN